jgi:hypothetical protein
VFGAGVRVETSVIDEEVYVTDAKGARVRVGCMCILARAEEEEETQDEHVCDGVRFRGVGAKAVLGRVGDDR